MTDPIPPFISAGNGHKFAIGQHRTVSLWSGKGGDAYVICTNHDSETRFRLSAEASNSLLILLQMHINKVQEIKESLAMELMQSA